MTQEKQRGGKRNGAGRKPAADPKETVRIYLEKSKVKANGGKETCQVVAYNYLTSRAKRKKK